MLFAGWHSDYTGERFLHLAIPLLTSAAAYGVLGLTSEPPFVIGAYCLAIVSNMGIAATFWLAPSEVLGVRSMAVGVAVTSFFVIMDAELHCCPARLRWIVNAHKGDIRKVFEK